MILWVYVVLFFLVIVVLSVINYRVNKEFKIETSWLALGLVPVIKGSWYQVLNLDLVNEWTML